MDSVIEVAKTMGLSYVEGNTVTVKGCACLREQLIMGQKGMAAMMQSKSSHVKSGSSYFALTLTPSSLLAFVTSKLHQSALAPTLSLNNSILADEKPTHDEKKSPLPPVISAESNGTHLFAVSPALESNVTQTVATGFECLSSTTCSQSDNSNLPKLTPESAKQPSIATSKSNDKNLVARDIMKSTSERAHFHSHAHF